MDAVEQATEDYFTDSTIDNPPREPKEGAGQGELFNTDEHEEKVKEFLDTQTPGEFEFKLTLALKPTSGNTNTITLPVAAGTCYSDRIEEILGKQFSSERFRKILRAIIGDPLVEEPKSDAAPTAATDTEEVTQ